MEEKELKVENIPGSYALCFNGECGKKDTCMHYQAMLLKRGERGCGMAIYPTAWQDGECCYYREYILQPGRMASAATIVRRNWYGRPGDSVSCTRT